MRHNNVICAIAKDEDRYLLEWAEHHFALGFDHIFVYDNLSARYIEDLFREAGLSDRVTAIRWPTNPGFSSQIDAYRHFVASYGKDVDWAAVIDIDEFINLKVDASISDFLLRFQTACAVAINWRIFGSSGHEEYSEEPLRSRFRQASHIEFEANKLCKTIHKMKYVTDIDIHNGTHVGVQPIQSPDSSVIHGEVAIPIAASNFEIAQINHYFVKSRGEWLAKLQRGYADNTVRPVEMFEAFDRNEILDESILRGRVV